MSSISFCFERSLQFDLHTVYMYIQRHCFEATCICCFQYLSERFVIKDIIVVQQINIQTSCTVIGHSPVEGPGLYTGTRDNSAICKCLVASTSFLQQTFFSDMLCLMLLNTIFFRVHGCSFENTCMLISQRHRISLNSHAFCHS